MNTESVLDGALLAEGRPDGVAEGRPDGFPEGRPDGVADGVADGVIKREVGADVFAVGPLDGTVDGDSVGVLVGKLRPLFVAICAVRANTVPRGRAFGM